MKQYNYIVPDVGFLKDLLQSQELVSCRKYKSSWIQIYSADNESEWYYSLGSEIRKAFPSAVIVGASSVGEIDEGKINTNSTIVLFSFFEEASLHLFSYECKPGREDSTGQTLLHNIEGLDADVKGVMLLSTPISNDSGRIFNIIAASDLHYPLFGGGAGDYANMKKTLVYDGDQCYKEGIVAVVFSGSNLFIEIKTYLEWHPLSKEMTITEVHDKSLKTIDNISAFSVYEKFLGIKADENFFQNSLEFPLLIQRNGQTIARTPFFVDEEEGSIQLVADVQEGEKFRIGYGNPQMILAESIQMHKKMMAFKPQAIFLYTCICRRFLMQQDVDMETLPFNAIAPTAGFYTFGEFCSNSKYNSLLNSTLVAVGFREGAKNKEMEQDEAIQKEKMDQEPDPFANQHSRILSRLLYFINETTKELEEQNEALNFLNKQKNEFLGIAAHDLRNPITAICGFSKLLEDQIGDELKEYTGIITQESTKMLDLLNDLLDISKIEAGILELNKQEEDYIAVVKQSIWRNNFLAQNKKIQITSDFESPTQWLFFDSGKMEQVLNNLISNAIKFSYPDSTITVKVYRENNRVVTQVIDQGQGIHEDEIDKIFYPFKKVSAKPTGGETSHGLGLAIVKKIIEAHDGQVGVKSEWGKGSIFCFTLPV